MKDTWLEMMRKENIIGSGELSKLDYPVKKCLSTPYRQNRIPKLIGIILNLKVLNDEVVFIIIIVR
jgi:hypothetical protein